MVVGCLTGSLFGGIQCGKLGRKKSLMLDSIVFTIGILIKTFAINFNMVLLGRFITGHAAYSAKVAIPIYTGEISQPKVRKITGSFTLLCYTVAYAMSTLFGKLFICWALSLNIYTKIL